MGQYRNFSLFSIGLFLPWAPVASEYCNVAVVCSALYTAIRMRYSQDAKPITLVASISILCISVNAECFFATSKVIQFEADWPHGRQSFFAMIKLKTSHFSITLLFQFEMT